MWQAVPVVEVLPAPAAIRLDMQTHMGNSHSRLYSNTNNWLQPVRETRLELMEVVSSLRPPMEHRD
jgi:hypothetical protein